MESNMVLPIGNSFSTIFCNIRQKSVDKTRPTSQRPHFNIDFEETAFLETVVLDSEKK